MTLMFKLDLDSVKMNQRAKYFGQRTFASKVIVQTHRRTHVRSRPIALPGPPNWAVIGGEESVSTISLSKSRGAATVISEFRLLHVLLL